MFSHSAHTRPPAKLNLFLELLARRDDGYHEIDTVMIPIDVCDELTVTRREQPGVELTVRWLPSKNIVAQRLGVDLQDPEAAKLLAIPEDETNLVHRAITCFTEAFGIEGGFTCDLGKRIPAGAGMGGASSDAASAIRCCAQLCDVPLNTPKLWEIAASIGSDVPFFLGVINDDNHIAQVAAGRATGRGEVLENVPLPMSLDVVVVYPGVSLSTSKVYANCRVPQKPQESSEILSAMASGDLSRFRLHLTNRLTEPAKKLASEIDETLKSMWRTGLRMCQLTGSGSACFAIASSTNDAKDCAARARAMLEPGAMVIATRGTRVPSQVVVTENTNKTR